MSISTPQVRDPAQLELWPPRAGLSSDHLRQTQLPPSWAELLQVLLDDDCVNIAVCEESPSGELLLAGEVRDEETGEWFPLEEEEWFGGFIARVETRCGACGNPGQFRELDRRRVACAHCAQLMLRDGMSFLAVAGLTYRWDGRRLSSVTEPQQTPLRHEGARPAAGAVGAPCTRPMVWTRARVLELRLQLREALTAQVVGDTIIDRMATLGAQWIASPRHTVVTLIGPAGSGKTTLVQAFVDALSSVPVPGGTGRFAIPGVLVSMAHLNEGPAWSGMSLGDAVAQLHTAGGGISALQQGAVLAVDDLDAVSLRRRQGAGRDFSRGAQRSLLPLLTGAAIPFNTGRARDTLDGLWATDRALVVVTARLSSLDLAPGTPPAPTDIARVGFPEVATRLGTILQMPPLNETDRRTLLRRLLAPAVGRFATWGYVLQPSDEAIAMAARVLMRAEPGLNVPAVLATMLSTADEVLERLLSEGAPAGTAVLLTPDDLRWPETKTRPGWRGD